MKKITLIILSSLSLWTFAIQAARFHHLVADNKIAQVRNLLEKDPSLANQLTEYGASPLKFVTSKEMAQLLLDNGADPNNHSLKHASPLMRALDKYKNGIAQLFLEKGADPLFQIFGDGDAVIHYAAGSGNIEGVQILLERGVDINMPGAAGHTPLGRAIKYGQFEMVKFLTSQGANMRALTKKNRSHEEIALWHVKDKPHSQAHRDIYNFITKKPIGTATTGSTPPIELPPTHHDPRDGFFSSNRNRLGVIVALSVSLWLLKRQDVFSKLKNLFQSSRPLSQTQKQHMLLNLQRLEADYTAKRLSYEQHQKKQREILHGLSPKQKEALLLELSSF